LICQTEKGYAIACLPDARKVPGILTMLL